MLKERRHIQDVDIDRPATTIETVCNLELAWTDKKLAIPSGTIFVGLAASVREPRDVMADARASS